MKIWTFHITGGEPFEMGFRGSPKLDHRGGPSQSLWKMCGGEAAKDAARDLMVQQGAKVEVYSEGQSEDQALLRGGRHLAIALAADTFDYSQVDEGIRHTVRMLRKGGFDTVYAVDGALDGFSDAEVRVQVSPASNLVPEALRLREYLEDLGVVFAPIGSTTPCIQGSYDPQNDSAVLSLFHTLIPELCPCSIIT